MDKVEQYQKDALLSFQEPVEPGRIEGMYLVFSGTNSTTGVTLSDLGTVIMKRNNRTIIDRPVEHFVELMNIRKGNNYFNSVDNGAFEATAFIPFYEESFEQALQIVNENELTFAYNPDTGTPGNFSDLTVTVYSSLALRNEGYEYHIKGADQTPASAVSSRNYPLNTSNITGVYLRDPNTVLTKAGLRVDGEQVFTEQSKISLIGATLLDNRLEVQDFDMVEMQVFTPNVAESLKNRNSTLQLSTSAGNTVEVTITSVHQSQGQ